MAQRPALSVLAMDAADDFADGFAECAADGVIDSTEITYLTPMVRLMQVTTQHVDLAQATGLAMIRRGETAQRTRGLLREVTTFMPLDLEAS